VLWEGFPLNNHSLGLADLSMIPAGLFSSVEVSPGTPSSAFGGGSLGGTVYLSSQQNRRQNHIEMSQTAGAYHTRSSRLQAAFESRGWNGSLQALLPYSRK
jgi:vitamin B12 transporter